MESNGWKAPDIPENVHINQRQQRLYIDISRDLFDTFGALKKALDTWEQEKEPQKEFMTQAVRIPVLINELAEMAGNKHFTGQVVRQVYCDVFCSDRPVSSAISHQIM